MEVDRDIDIDIDRETLQYQYLYFLLTYSLEVDRETLRCLGFGKSIQKIFIIVHFY